MIHSSQGKHKVSARKTEQLQHLLATISYNQKSLPVKMLASVIEKIISMSPALGTVARFMTS